MNSPVETKGQAGGRPNKAPTPATTQTLPLAGYLRVRGRVQKVEPWMVQVTRRWDYAPHHPTFERRKLG